MQQTNVLLSDTVQEQSFDKTTSVLLFVPNNGVLNHHALGFVLQPFACVSHDP